MGVDRRRFPGPNPVFGQFSIDKLASSRSPLKRKRFLSQEITADHARKIRVPIDINIDRTIRPSRANPRIRDHLHLEVIQHRHHRHRRAGWEQRHVTEITAVGIGRYTAYPLAAAGIDAQNGDPGIATRESRPSACSRQQTTDRRMRRYIPRRKYSTPCIASPDSTRAGAIIRRKIAIDIDEEIRGIRSEDLNAAVRTRGDDGAVRNDGAVKCVETRHHRLDYAGRSRPSCQIVQGALRNGGDGRRVSRR
jgi:hypothetical protein